MVGITETCCHLRTCQPFSLPIAIARRPTGLQSTPSSFAALAPRLLPSKRGGQPHGANPDRAAHLRHTPGQLSWLRRPERVGGRSLWASPSRWGREAQQQGGKAARKRERTSWAGLPGRERRRRRRGRRPGIDWAGGQSPTNRSLVPSGHGGAGAVARFKREGSQMHVALVHAPRCPRPTPRLSTSAQVVDATRPLVDPAAEWVEVER